MGGCNVVDMRLINPDKLHWFWQAAYAASQGGGFSWSVEARACVISGIKGHVSPPYTNMTEVQAKAWRGRL